jgi:uncharacterized protein YukE
MTWKRFTPRQEADAIEQFADDLAKLLKAFDRTCDRMTFDAYRLMARIAHQDELDGIAAGFAKLAQAMHNVCDEAAEADDRRRDNPLAHDFRRLGQ